MGGTSKKNLQKIQNIQDKTAKLVLGRESYKMSKRQRLLQLKWQNVTKMAQIAQLKLTNRILNTGKPEVTHQIFTNYKLLNTKKERKLAPYPIGTTTKSHQTYMARARTYNNLPPHLTMIAQKSFFKNSLEKYLKNGTFPDTKMFQRYYHERPK